MICPVGSLKRGTEPRIILTSLTGKLSLIELLLYLLKRSKIMEPVPGLLLRPSAEVRGRTKPTFPPEFATYPLCHLSPFAFASSPRGEKTEDECFLATRAASVAYRAGFARAMDARKRCSAIIAKTAALSLRLSL